MNNWQNSTQNIKFKGHDEVLLKISDLKKEKKNLIHKIIDLLDYEISIPTRGLVVYCSVFILAVSLRLTYFTPQSFSYSITVINERGEYEKTY
jgi:predicted RNA-binding protein associated with RNAse of E/G family